MEANLQMNKIQLTGKDNLGIFMTICFTGEKS